MEEQKQSNILGVVGSYIGIALLCAVLGGVAGYYWRVFPKIMGYDKPIGSLVTHGIGPRNTHSQRQREMARVEEKTMEAINETTAENGRLGMMIGIGVGAVAGIVAWTYIRRRLQMSPQTPEEAEYAAEYKKYFG